MTKQRILFVDDEPMVLRGIRRMLRDERKIWDILFAESGQAALETMAEAPVDVIISDIKMPDMDGVELLEHVKDRHPETVRIAMTGESSANVAILSALTVHRFLSKPCREDELKSAIIKSLEHFNILEDEPLRRMVSGVHRLPSVPEIFQQLSQELEKDNPTVEAVAAIISQDVSMCAKMMQLVNSSFFGFARHIESPEQAVTLLGIRIIKALVLSFHVFDEFDVSKTPGFTLQYLWEHSLRVSNLTRAVCRGAGFTKKEADHAFLTGILHDVGKLVLAANFPDGFNDALNLVRGGGHMMWEAEKQVLGHSHSEVGAYLMGLWGLPDEIVEGIAFHHEPTKCPRASASLVAVHVADTFDHRLYSFSSRSIVPFVDGVFLQQWGYRDQIPEWWQEAQEYMEALDGGA